MEVEGRSVHRIEYGNLDGHVICKDGWRVTLLSQNILVNHNGVTLVLILNKSVTFTTKL